MDQIQQDQQTEQQKLDETLRQIVKQEAALLDRTGVLKDSVVELRKGFWDDVTVNLDDPDEAIETYASIKQQAELLSERERSHGQLSMQLRKLKQLKDSPYFGRIDFKEEGEEEDQIYIGRSSLMDEHEEEFLVYDWRAPISSMYYDFSPGPAEYETMEGTISGDMSLKRQYIIQQGKLKGMFDTGITIGDHLLQQALGNQASTQMKSIVATIQREQNKIIRNERSKYLVVQGVAGSGKTSAALQRVAYLLYRYRGLLNENNMVLFSPNSLFNSYVANVLPELGEENIQQTTYLDHVHNNVDDLTVESPFEQMEYTLTKEDDEQYALRMENIQFKSSVAYKRMIDEFIDDLNNEGLLFRDLVFRDELFIASEEIETYFYSLDPVITIANKIELVSTWLLHQLKDFKEQEVDKDWVMEEVELLDDGQLTAVYHELQQREDMEEFYDSGKEEQHLREEVVDEAIQPLVEMVEQLRFVKLIETYEQLFSEWEPYNERHERWEQLCTLTRDQFAQSVLTWEEATPFIYFKGKVLGERANRSIRHLIIDEAQDYTPFQMAYLKHIFPHTNMTMLGDINQAIYAQTRKGNPLLDTEGKQVERIELTKSYRSTKQIVEFTSGFAPSSEVIQSFERNGKKPKLIKVDERDQFEQIKQSIEKLLNQGHETIGIVCKTIEESKFVEKQLTDKIAVKRIDESTQTFEKGVLILPIYLAKGIEFDAVVIPDGSSEHYVEKDQTLFYTACTRAMHELVIFSTSDWCIFIDQVDPQYYELVR